MNHLKGFAGSALTALAFGIIAGCATKDMPVMSEDEIAAATAESLTEEYEFDYNDHILRYRMHAPVRTEMFRRYPLVVFLHGSGERGEDNSAQLRHGVEPLCKYALRHGDAYVVAPQCPSNESWVVWDWSKQSMTRPALPNRETKEVLELIEDLCERYPIDRDRIYVTGLSMGGFGTWDIITRKTGLFAAAVPVCGGVDERAVRMYRGTALWFFHGEKDTAVSVEYSRRMKRALDNAGIPHVYTEYPGVGHNSWEKAYADEKMLKWLFSIRKGK